ncbi:hypothetical protein CEP54_002641 [Fusarium duplospermum]|uniref:Transcription factor domain-containing protein n=1 Tax=Fusarium duplospermum TaxID=1325734 RepID=A0A428QTT0_9HYPO|nr:hypothetical protein CEP54_002641 [Fusarium duplospermum]
MTNMSHGAKLVDQMQRLLSLPTCYSMLRQWSAQETNLALAGSFVDQCAETVRFPFPEEPESPVDNVGTAKLLFANSGRQLITDPADTPGNYASQFCQKNARWETLGLFCTAVSRATIDVMNAQGSYKTSMRYRGLSRLAMQFSDAFLEIAVYLDCLNDLKLLLQYENFILHSMVDGDQTLQEDILDLSNSMYSTDSGQRAEDIQRLAETLWKALPTKFKLQGPLKQSNQSPVITDFLVSARLNYMHISFLLRLVLIRGKAQFDTTLSIISAEMLGIVVEAIILKHRLLNSGTSLVWKVAYYGLAAAGALCLWLLNESPETRNSGVSRSKVFRHPSVLVAEVEAGTLVEADDSNYKLLVSASKTISTLLDQILQGTIGRQRRDGDVFDPSLLAGIRNQTEWSPWDNAALQEFELDFWMNLAGHPSLIGVENLGENGSQPPSHELERF